MENKLRLAISIGCLDIGGAEVFVVNLLKKINYNLFDVLLIVLSGKHHTFLENEVEKLPIKILYLQKKEGFNRFIMIKITNILRRYKPNILHGNIGGLIYFLLYIWTTKIKCIHTVHTLNEFNRFKIMILRNFYKRGKMIPVAISKAIVEDIKRNYWLDHSYLITNGIDTTKYIYKRDFNLSHITIGHVGRFESVKNHQTIIEVYRILKDKLNQVSLYLIGNGSLFDKYYQALKDESNVTIKKSSDKIHDELKKIDIFIFPSICEGFPIALIEALASGCVIIASNIGGVNEIIEDKVNGYLIDDYYDSQKIANIILELLNNKNKMLEISKNNNEKAKQYDLNAMAELYQELYKKEATKC